MKNTHSTSTTAKIITTILVLATIVGLGQVFSSNYASDYNFDATLTMSEQGQIEHLISSTETLSETSVQMLLINN